MHLKISARKLDRPVFGKIQELAPLQNLKPVAKEVQEVNSPPTIRPDAHTKFIVHDYNLQLSSSNVDWVPIWGAAVFFDGMKYFNILLLHI